MKRLITLTIQYYRTLLLYNISFTVLSVFLLFATGFGTNPVGLFFAKLSGLAAAVGLHYYSSGKTYFYYRNAGVTIRRLYTYAWLIDVAVFIVLILTASICRHLF